MRCSTHRFHLVGLSSPHQGADTAAAAFQCFTTWAVDILRPRVFVDDVTNLCAHTSGWALRPVSIRLCCLTRCDLYFAQAQECSRADCQNTEQITWSHRRPCSTCVGQQWHDGNVAREPGSQQRRVHETMNALSARYVPSARADSTSVNPLPDPGSRLVDLCQSHDSGLKISMLFFLTRLMFGMRRFILASYLCVSIAASCRPFYHYWAMHPDPGSS